MKVNSLLTVVVIGIVVVGSASALVLTTYRTDLACAFAPSSCNVTIPASIGTVSLNVVVHFSDGSTQTLQSSGTLTRQLSVFVGSRQAQYAIVTVDDKLNVTDIQGQALTLYVGYGPYNNAQPFLKTNPSSTSLPFTYNVSLASLGTSGALDIYPAVSVKTSHAVYIAGIRPVVLNMTASAQSTVTTSTKTTSWTTTVGGVTATLSSGYVTIHIASSSSTHAPIAGATVTSNTGTVVTTDANGNAQFVANPPSGVAQYLFAVTGVKGYFDDGIVSGGVATAGFSCMGGTCNAYLQPSLAYPYGLASTYTSAWGSTPITWTLMTCSNALATFSSGTAPSYATCDHLMTLYSGSVSVTSCGWNTQQGVCIQYNGQQCWQSSSPGASSACFSAFNNISPNPGSWNFWAPSNGVQYLSVGYFPSGIAPGY